MGPQGLPVFKERLDQPELVDNLVRMGPGEPLVFQGPLVGLERLAQLGRLVIMAQRDPMVRMVLRVRMALEELQDSPGLMDLQGQVE